MLIDSFNVHVHSVVRMRYGMLVDPFELPAVLRGRNDTPLNIAARSAGQSIRLWSTKSERIGTG